MAARKKSAKKPPNLPVERKYNWAPGRGAMFRNVAVEVVGKEIERLGEKYSQQLEPRHVVAEARNPKSPIHNAFNWDKEQAAEAYWIITARNLLKSVQVTIITPEHEERVVPVFVSTLKSKDAKRRQYSSTEYAMGDVELRGEVLKLALREFASLRRKYAELSELAIVFAAVDKLQKSIAA
jgi:hypothetical protein